MIYKNPPSTPPSLQNKKIAQKYYRAYSRELINRNMLTDENKNLVSQLAYLDYQIERFQEEKNPESMKVYLLLRNEAVRIRGELFDPEQYFKMKRFEVAEKICEMLDGSDGNNLADDEKDYLNLQLAKWDYYASKEFMNSKIEWSDLNEEEK
jgi:hypothetical protein